MNPLPATTTYWTYKGRYSWRKVARPTVLAKEARAFLERVRPDPTSTDRCPLNPTFTIVQAWTLFWNAIKDVHDDSPIPAHTYRNIVRSFPRGKP